jgi:hypothetical protein
MNYLGAATKQEQKDGSMELFFLQKKKNKRMENGERTKNGAGTFYLKKPNNQLSTEPALQITKLFSQTT